MGIYIKGMTMQSCCDGCMFSDWSNLHQTACCKMRDYDPCFEYHSMDYREKRADFCPLVEIPEPHGDLIDRDALLKKTINNPLHAPYIVAKDIRDMPPIIEAEGGEDDADN